mmetsp:Transcript_45211/g.94243  ORF Transcript_45211/g.94243 Transcript_45211/m.94243 type:complete len:96 (-) Transcript_45211:45-332(-)
MRTVLKIPMLEQLHCLKLMRPRFEAKSHERTPPTLFILVSNLRLLHIFSRSGNRRQCPSCHNHHSHNQQRFSRCSIWRRGLRTHAPKTLFQQQRA